MSERIQQTDLFEQAKLDRKDDAGEPDWNIPMRFRPRRASPEEVENRNEEYGFTRARKYYPPEEAIEMARTAKSAPVDDRIKSWVNHPDERVAIAMLENPNEPYKVRAQAPLIATVLLERALRSAQENDELWNPFFDCLCCSRGANARRTWWSKIRFGKTLDSEDIQDLDIRPNLPKKSDAQLAEVQSWLSEQTDPRKAERLLDFKASAVHEAVAQHTRCMDARLMDRLLGIDQGQLSHELARNRHLSEAIRKRLFNRLLEILREKKEHPPINPEHIDPEERRYVYGYGGPCRYLGGALKTLTASSSFPSARPDNWKEQIIELAQPPEWMYRLREKKGKSFSYRNSPWVQAVSAMLQDELQEDVGPEELLALYPGAAIDSYRTRDIIRHPNANIKVWREVVTDTSFFKVRKWLSQREQARKDPVIREVLSSSTSPKVMVKLLKEAEGDEFRYLFRQVSKKKPQQALRILHDGTAERIQTLGPHDLLPMIQSEDREVRQQAMLALKGLKQEKQEEDPQKSRSQTPTRE